MPKYRGLYDFLYNNKQLQCSVSGCYANRVGMSQYCSRHRSRAYVWGHPQAGPVKPQVYDQELEAVTKVIGKNDGHDGIAYGRGWLGRMMELGSQGANIRAAEYWANLGQLQVEPNDLLIRLAGLWLFERHDEIRRYIKSDRHATALTGHAVVRFKRIPRLKYVPPKIYRQVGHQVRMGVGPLLINIAIAAEKMERQQQEARSAMTKKLSII